MSGSRPSAVAASLAAAKLLSPDGRHRLLNDTVFQFNDQYRRFWRRDSRSLSMVDGKRVAFIVPAMFDKASRTFNWIAVSDPFLGHPFEAESSDRDLARAVRKNAIIQFLTRMRRAFPTTDGDDWRRFAGRFSDSPHAEVALKCVEGYIDAARVSRKELADALRDDELTRLWIAVSTLYSTYSHPRDQYFEGLFYSILEKSRGQNPELVGAPVFGRLTGATMDLSVWLAQPDIAEHTRTLNLQRKKWRGDAPTTMVRSGYTKDRAREARLTERALLDPLLMNWGIDDGGEVRPFKEWLTDFNLLALQPLYDVWIDSEGYGALQGVLLLFLKPDTEGVSGKVGQPSWAKAHYAQLLKRCDQFAREVSQTAIQRALATPIKPPYDLVRHFLRIIVEVQDWDEATVFYDGEANYQYRRATHDQIRPRPVRTIWEEDKDGVAAERANPAGGLIAQDGAFYMWWTCEERIPSTGADGRPQYNLWSKDFLADLNENERAAFEGTSIRFKFPQACRIPRDLASRSFMVESYLRQQLELMRVLIPKVRARRAALRNAVSAIMGRNMSHNIGSHVLARYANQIGLWTPPAEKEPSSQQSERPDPRSDFLLYLQRRMDFLAEVATSDRSLSAQPLVLKGQLENLNLAVQRNRYGYDSPNSTPAGGLPLLQNITGKHGLDATVSFEACNCAGSESRMFACPGGEVGVHALFVILENIIRNSARHNDAVPLTDAAKAAVTIVVRPLCPKCASGSADRIGEAHSDGLFQLQIIDQRTQLAPSGKPLARARDPEAEALDKHINDIIESKPIIDPDGRPSPNYWGIREMQVCAQYLRQLQLSDLEDVPHSPDDGTAGKAPLIRANCERLESGEHCLSYTIFLQDARLLALLEDVKGNSEIAPTGVTKMVVPSKRIVSGQPLTALGDLPMIGAYSFVAYSPGLSPTIQKHRSQLPTRLLELPLSISRGTFDADTLVNEVRTSPAHALEALHEAYARQQCKARPPVGLVIGTNEAIRLPDKLKCGNMHVRQVTSPKMTEIEDILVRNDSDNFSVWLDHAGHSQIKKLLAKIPSERLISLEPCFSGSETTSALEGLANGQSWELISASVSRVLVLDERVQAEANTPLRGTFRVGDCWDHMRIRVPAVESCNLDHPTCEAIEAYCSSLALETFDFVILHLTVLEKVCSQLRHSSIFKTLRVLFDNKEAFAQSQIVIVTGRGIPAFAQGFSADRVRLDAEMACRTKYLPISAVLEYLTRYPSKVGLMRAIWGISGTRLGGAL